MSMVLGGLLTIGSISLFVVGFILLRHLNNTHVSAVIIERPFSIVWEWIANPSMYGLLYPHWVKQILPQESHVFLVNDQFGKSYNVVLSEEKTWGIVDLKMAEEGSRIRLYPLDEHRTLLVHVATRWKGASFLMWFFHQRTTDKDLKNAKHVIEQHQG